MATLNENSRIDVMCVYISAAFVCLIGIILTAIRLKRKQIYNP